MRGYFLLFCAAVGLSGAFAAQSRLDASGAQVKPAEHVDADARRVLDTYCVRCHNQRLKTAGLMLDKVDAGTPSAEPEIWEKVIRKLRTGAMPPAGSPRPDQATYEVLASSLENDIDRAWTAKPNPGRTEIFHRLNRAEYQNVIRDVLAVDIDVSALLPRDDISYGFDNIAGILKVSPTLMDRYMAVARQISRVAVGDRALPPTAVTFRLRSDLSQNDETADLPLGTRGGTAIRYQFPLDGQYEVKIEVIGRAVDQHQLEVSLDGAPVKVFPIGGARRPPANVAGDVGPPEPDRLAVRFPVKAGPRQVAVTFIKKTSALEETVREPFWRPHSEGGGAPVPYVASVTITGPFEATGASGTPSRARIFVCEPTGPADEPACARKIIAALARRGYRRPVTDTDLQGPLTFYAEGRKKGTFDSGIEMALRAILVSPEFLFRIEPDPTSGPDVYRLNDLQLASRLSFFLWSSIPDDDLLNVASHGTLHQPAVLDQQVRRMLADPRTRALAANFTGQWLQLRNLEAASPDEYLFPNFGENLRQDFRTETELFFESLLRENRSVLDLLTADYTFLDERLAKHYGIPNVYGPQFRRVTIPDENRRGLLGQGSFLTVTSLADRTNVVSRGKWILDNILGAPPPPPPPNVPPLKEQPAAGRVLSLRERMAQHRANPVCASCHAQMDPLGFALENFDATGQWRSTEGFQPIDTSATLPGGAAFDGPVGLRGYLLSRPNQIVTGVAEKLLIYALGRGVEYYDAPAIRKITRDAAADHYSFASLISGIIKSAPFEMRARVSPSSPASTTAGQ
jgi:mono/diheme cytochrome c family protein